MRQQADFVKTRLTHRVEHGDDVVVLDVFVCRDDHRRLVFATFGKHGLQRARQLAGAVDGAFGIVFADAVDQTVALGGLVFAEGERDGVNLGRLRRLPDAGQFHAAGGHHRRGDHEDDEQNEHHVDIGHDVDLIDEAAALAHDGGFFAETGGLAQVALENVGELFHEALKTDGEAVDVVREAVVGDKGGNRGKQANGGGDQRLGNAGGDLRERGGAHA